MKTPSRYQQAIYDFILHGTGNAVVEAKAGSGKTSTLVGAIERLNPTLRSIFIAFNKHIAMELSDRLSMQVEMGQAECTTLNALGWRICRQNNKRVKLDADKTDKTLRFDIIGEGNNRYYQCRKSIVRLVSLAKSLGIKDPANLVIDYRELADKFGVMLPKNEEELGYPVLLEDTYTRCLQKTIVLDFDDQIAQPVFQNWELPKYDLIFVDEAQDMAPIQIEFIKRMEGRVIAVGDTHQAIYGFRGADSEAMLKLKSELAAVELPLSICYRCAKSIVVEAQKIVPDIEYSETANEGIVESVKQSDLESLAGDGDYVLCRTTAPLVEQCLAFIRKGRAAYVKGRDIGKNLVDLITAICPDKSTVWSEFRDLLGAYVTKEMERLERLQREAEQITLQDKSDTLLALLADVDDVTGLIAKIESIFVDDGRGVTFCTVHKSKGLEADKVFILAPELMPHPKCSQEWQRVQEMNLKYVAITRAKKHLLWVDGGKRNA